jgi:phospholipid/cholesterol/gamma-HCH transport system ATP-binding protein
LKKTRELGDRPGPKHMVSNNSTNNAAGSPEPSKRMEPLIRIERLAVDFGPLAVLRDVSLSLARGETLAVIGESGCGKTVFLKTIIGLLQPSDGAVYFDGHNLSTLDDRELTRQRIRFGFLFQQAALFDSMTVFQNVAFPLRQHTAMDHGQIKQTVMARLLEVGLPEEVLIKKPAELSGGMRKRVGLARALAMEPEVMLYDEPTTGLDPIMSDVINELLINARRQHPVTSVVVTHDMRTAQKVADRIVMLYPLGRLGDGEPQIVYDGPADKIDDDNDPRVRQFVRGEAGERLMEMRRKNGMDK